MHPILFEVGGFTIYSYGFFIALGAIADVETNRAGGQALECGKRRARRAARADQAHADRRIGQQSGEQ